ncbi:hypothetical protein MA16_Dca027102 [Dendrobium catenatum]|uniref:Endonuclease/exonuclease/phosphatase domain-containing protein n=1 Tax=Dendrobium catenatum TaxID=906689 RepID=A0A2I0V9X5_9ASPA|nr:hypothetical protein MA16_Dca027102 [Dendrobium catenatum]
MSSILFWNCRGAKKTEAALYLKEIVKEYRVFFIGLLETKISSQDNNQLLKFLGSNWSSSAVPAAGLSGGIMVLWRNDLATFSVIEATSQMILGNLEVQSQGN